MKKAINQQKQLGIVPFPLTKKQMAKEAKAGAKFVYEAFLPEYKRYSPESIEALEQLIHDIAAHDCSRETKMDFLQFFAFYYGECINKKFGTEWSEGIDCNPVCVDPATPELEANPRDRVLYIFHNQNWKLIDYINGLESEGFGNSKKNKL
jgi:hypothetical protein